MDTRDPAPSGQGLEDQLDRVESQLVLYARDLKLVVDSERRKARELEQANARLQLLDKLKTDFLSFISHELRTPLNAMSILTLSDDSDDPQQRTETIEMARSGYERLAAFIAKGLEYFSWMAAEQYEAAETVDLSAVVRSVADAHVELAGADVLLQLPPSPPGVPVQAREDHLVRIVSVLLDNAVKFSGKDRRLAVRLTLTDSTTRLDVTDSGVGIERGLAPELFRPFTIGDVRHHSAGSGLNLAIAQAIATAYGGKLVADSPGPGCGSTFTLELPTVPQSALVTP